MIAGNKVILGALAPVDFAPLYVWLNDVEAARFDFSYRPIDLATHLQWCQNVSNDPSKVVFAIRRCGDPAIIGYLKISNINSVHRSADIGIRIGDESNRNQGFGTEAIRLAVDYCWKYLNLERISLIVFSANARAIGVYRTVGFKKEGLLRRYCFIDGEWIDAVIMAIFRPTRRQTHKPNAVAAQPRVVQTA